VHQPGGTKESNQNAKQKEAAADQRLGLAVHNAAGAARSNTPKKLQPSSPNGEKGCCSPQNNLY
jgi:hypothetical protein